MKQDPLTDSRYFMDPLTGILLMRDGFYQDDMVHPSIISKLAYFDNGEWVRLGEKDQAVFESIYKALNASGLGKTTIRGGDISSTTGIPTSEVTQSLCRLMKCGMLYCVFNGHPSTWTRAVPFNKVPWGTGHKGVHKVTRSWIIDKGIFPLYRHNRCAVRRG